MPQPTGGKVNASNLNVEGLDEVATPLLTDNLMLSRDGVQNEKVLLSAIAGAVIPDPLLLSDGTEAAPSLAFTLDIDTGLYRDGANVLGVTVGGAGVALFDVTGIRSEHGSGPLIVNGPPSATVPTLVPNLTDPNTGIGRRGADIGTLIAGGVQVAEFFESGGVPQFIVPSVNNNAFPTLAFGDGDTGFFESSANVITCSIAGNSRWQFTDTTWGSTNGARPVLRNEVPSATNPVILVRLNDLDTGIGSSAADVIQLIAGGLQCMEVAENAAAPEIAFYGTTAIPLQTGVAVTAAAIHAALVALGLITA